MSSRDVVERAKAALEGVTEGPWVDDFDPYEPYDVPVKGADGNYLARCGDCGVRGGFSQSDAEFIAAARSLVPELLEAIKRRDATLAEVRATAEYWRADKPRLPQALRQGADTVLAILDRDGAKS